MSTTGIDVYLHWEEQTDDEVAAQATGFDVTMGRVGYLREAYHGGPYVTQWLMPECWHLGEAKGVRQINEETHTMIAGVFKSLSQAAAAMPGDKLTIEGPTAEIKDDIPDYPPEGYLVEVEEVVDPEYPDDGPAGARIPAQVLELRLPLCQAVYEQRVRKVYGHEPDAREWASFVDFVALVRQLEEAGRKPWIYASY